MTSASGQSSGAIEEIEEDEGEELPSWGSVFMSALAVVFFAGLAGLWDLYILGAAVMGYDSCGAGHRCNAALGTAGLVVSAVVFCGGLLLMLVGVARYAFGKRDARIWHGVGAAALLLSGFVGAVLIGQSAGVPFIDVGALRA